MAEGLSVSDIFEDKEGGEVPEIAEQPEGSPRDDKGRFAAKGEDESASPAPLETDDEPAFDHAAVKGERARRQAAEAERDTDRQRVAALEDQIKSLQQPPAPAPSMWEDEQGWQQHFGSEVVSTAVQQATFNARLDMSEMMVRQANPDFEAVKGEFLALAEVNPQLREQALADPHPWDKAYRLTKNHQKMQALGAVDVADMEAKIEARIRGEMAAQPAPQQAIPSSLADAQSARLGSPSAPAPMSLRDILGG